MSEKTLSFLPDEEQQELVDLTKDVLAAKTTDERVAQVDDQPDVWDTELYETLLETGIVEALIGDDEDSGMGTQGLMLVAEQCGRYLARVPLLATALTGQILLETGHQELVDQIFDGELTTAIGIPGALESVTLSDGNLTGRVSLVGGGNMASHFVVLTTDDSVALVASDALGVETSPVGWGYTEDLAVDFAVAAQEVVMLDGVNRENLLARWQVVLAALTTGACRSAIARTAEYVSGREQFGAPLSTKQGVALQAADAHIDTESIWLTTMNAAVALDAQGHDPLQIARYATEAAWWANTAGVRVVHTTQHLHGGMGADTDGHIHRFFTFVRGIAVLLGPADALLTTLGEKIVSLPKGSLS